MTLVYIDQVIADSRCQSRSGIDLSLVNDYAEAIRDGAEMPPLSTIKSGDSYYLYDGFHRLRAYLLAGKKQVPIAWEDGDVWDAIERSCAVNAEHGKRRTNDDKRRAVETMIKVMQHKGENWSNREIARRCAVSHQFVNNTRPESLATVASDGPERTYTDRWGNQSTMNTANIGKYRAPKIDMDFDDEEVDEDTGEIHSPPSPPRDHPLPPVQKLHHRGQLDTLEFMDYGADDPELTYKSIAFALIHDYGRAAALRIAAHITREAK